MRGYENINSLSIALLFECPFGNELDTCVFKKFREISIEERIRIFENLKYCEKKEIINKHNSCLQKRESYFYKETVYKKLVK